MSMVARRVALIQKNGQFTDIESNLGEAHFTIQSDQRGSAVNNETVSGYWLQWIEPDMNRGPILEIGQDGQETPFFTHMFDQFCFDCDSQDQSGWRGLDVQLPRASKIFRPKFWTLNAIEGITFLSFNFTTCNVQLIIVLNSMFCFPLKATSITFSPTARM